MCFFFFKCHLQSLQGGNLWTTYSDSAVCNNCAVLVSSDYLGGKRQMKLCKSTKFTFFNIQLKCWYIKAIAVLHSSNSFVFVWDTSVKPWVTSLVSSISQPNTEWNVSNSYDGTPQYADLHTWKNLHLFPHSFSFCPFISARWWLMSFIRTFVLREMAKLLPKKKKKSILKSEAGYVSLIQTTFSSSYVCVCIFLFWLGCHKCKFCFMTSRLTFN